VLAANVGRKLGYGNGKLNLEASYAGRGLVSVEIPGVIKKCGEGARSEASSCPTILWEGPSQGVSIYLSRAGQFIGALSKDFHE
jgi:hypothetical protein